MTPAPDPHFVIGSGRSGTTLIAASMGNHPALRFIDEPRFLAAILLPAAAGALSEEEFRRRVATRGDGSGKEPMKFLRRMEEHYGAQLGTEGMAELRQKTAAMMDRFWRSPRDASDIRDTLQAIIRFVNARLGPRHWLIKEPELSVHVETLAALFPKARFIHVHRNVEDVLSSRVERRFQPSLDAALDVWAARVASIAGFARLAPERIFHCRFESFVTEPAAALDALFEFLGCEADDDAVRVSTSLVRAGDANIGRARDAFDAAQRQRIAARAEPFEHALGFSLRGQTSMS
jgi:hypothetical protein